MIYSNTVNRKTLLSKYGNSVVSILKQTHPETNWSEVFAGQRSQSDPQEALQSILGDLVHKEWVFTNYRREFPGLLQ